MSRKPFEWSRSAPKKPPPEHGIRMKKSGSTWWGQQWIRALEVVLGADAGRLGRGRTYARGGRTHDFVLAAGSVAAKVTGSRPEPYTVTIELTRIANDVWQRAIGAMAGKARFAAELLGGQMPQDIESVFREQGVSLFPATRADLTTRCTCPDWGDPCKHVAATHYVLGEALDRDPFLLLELRGRDKQRFLAELRAARARANAGPDPEPEEPAVAALSRVAEPSSVSLGTIDALEYDRPRAPLPSLRLSFEVPSNRAAVLRQLGAPAAWNGGDSPVEWLDPVVRAAADAARRIALAEPAPAPADPQRPAATLPEPTHAEDVTAAKTAPRKARKRQKPRR